MVSCDLPEGLCTERFNVVNIATPAPENKKFGRPSQWTDSRQRQLAQLYLYTNLPPQDIRQALSDEIVDWVPEKETTTKTLNSLLDKYPRWLRPRTREEMDERILQLANCKAQRKFKRQLRQDRLIIHFDAIMEDSATSINLELNTTSEPSATTCEAFDHPIEAAETFSWTEFTPTPVQDLLTLYQPLSPTAALFQMQNMADGSTSTNETTQDASVAQHNRPLMAPAEAVFLESEFVDAVGTNNFSNRPTTTPSRQLEVVTDLLQSYSITGSSSASTSKPFGRRSVTSTSTIIPSTKRFMPRSQPTEVALPNAFLVADLHRRGQGPCFSGLWAHDSSTCWCLPDLELLPESMTWCTKERKSLPLEFDAPYFLRKGIGSLEFRDAFGNTDIHFLAARGANLSVIWDAMERGADVTAKNAAGQTFLHCFGHDFLVNLARDGAAAMMAFLQKLIEFNVNFQECDPFGRRFAHLITYEAKDVLSHSLYVLDFLNIRLPLSRDAFGWLPVLDSTHTRPRVDSEPSFPRWHKDLRADFGDSRDARTVLPNSPSSTQPGMVEYDKRFKPLDPAGTSLILKHARLLETAAAALDVPSTEDSRG